MLYRGRIVTPGSPLFKMAHLDLAAWRVHLQDDRAQFREQMALADPITSIRDAKLAELKNHIEAKVQHPPVDTDRRRNRRPSSVSLP